MSFEEKSAWIMGVLAVAAYTTYLVIVLGLAQAAPLTEVDYVPALLWTIGAVAAMLMAMFRFDYFWIANLIYLCFVLSAILGTITKIVSYRRGLPSW